MAQLGRVVDLIREREREQILVMQSHACLPTLRRFDACHDPSSLTLAPAMFLSLASHEQQARPHYAPPQENNHFPTAI